MNIEEQAIEENDFRESIKMHLENIKGRNIECGFFGTFFEEEEIFERCLLCEIKNSCGERYFTPQDVTKICNFYRGSDVQFKCTYKPGIISNNQIN